MKGGRYIQGWLALAVMAALPAGAVAAELVPHKARYDIALESLQTEGVPLEASGAMATQLTRDCQKWEYLQEMQFSVGVEGGQPVELHIQIRMLEGLDGRRMEFSGWQKRGDRELVELRGKAFMNRDGYGGEAKFVRPEEVDWKLPSPTKLPIAATKELLGALSKGGAEPQSIMFEVLGVSEVTRITAGGSINLKAVETEDASLLKRRSWLVDRAIYFEEIGGNEPFMFETVQIHANGVVSKFWQDYHTMVLSGELVALEELPAPDC